MCVLCAPTTEFLQQTRHFMSNLQIYKLQPLTKAGKSQAQASIFDLASNNKANATPASRRAAAAATAEVADPTAAIQTRRIQEFCSLISFLSHAAPLYKAEVTALNIPGELYTLLFDHCETLDPVLRKTLTQALILLQNRGMIPRTELMPALFRCYRCADKDLRRDVFQHMIADIQKLTKSSPSQSVVGALQKIVFTMMKDDHPGVALKAMQILVELWRRNTWVCEAVANAMANMCFGTSDKLISAALYYFLGNYDMDDDEESDTRNKIKDRKQELAIVASSLKHSRSKMKKERMLKRESKKLKKQEKDLESDDEEDDEDAVGNAVANMNPISMVYDPQHFVERLFHKLKSSRESFATRMLIMEVISKLIGYHKLLLFNFYPFIQRYLQPHQRHVNDLLAFATRGTHSLVPPEVLQPMVKTIATNFITDRSQPEVMAVGINAIREISARQPLVMSEALLHDLSEYARHKNKGIVTATRSLISVFRQLNPELLRRKDRGRDGQLAVIIQRGDDDIAKQAREEAAAKLHFGASTAHRDIDGADLLARAGMLREGQTGDDSDEWEGNHEFEDDFIADNAALEDDDDTPDKLPKYMKKKLYHLKGEARRKYLARLVNSGYALPGGNTWESARERGVGDEDDEDEDEVRFHFSYISAIRTS